MNQNSQLEDRKKEDKKTKKEKRILIKKKLEEEKKKLELKKAKFMQTYFQLKRFKPLEMLNLT